MRKMQQRWFQLRAPLAGLHPLTLDQIVRSQVKFFCAAHVDYTAACDMDNDPQLGFNPSCNNSFAMQVRCAPFPTHQCQALHVQSVDNSSGWQVYSNFERALSVYSCGEYSRIWTCQHCTFYFPACHSNSQRCGVGTDAAVHRQGSVQALALLCIVSVRFRALLSLPSLSSQYLK